MKNLSFIIHGNLYKLYKELVKLACELETTFKAITSSLYGLLIYEKS